MRFSIETFEWKSLYENVRSVDPLRVVPSRDDFGIKNCNFLREAAIVSQIVQYVSVTETFEISNNVKEELHGRISVIRLE